MLKGISSSVLLVISAMRNINLPGSMFLPQYSVPEWYVNIESFLMLSAHLP